MKHFKAFTLPFSDPDLIDDASSVYGDDELFPEIDDPCEKSPNSHHEFNCLSDPEVCIHCGRRC